MTDSFPLVWRKSSFSGASENCVEIAWRKSSYSGSGANCVEVARRPDLVYVRDSKNPDGPVLSFPRAAFPVRTFG